MQLSFKYSVNVVLASCLFTAIYAEGVKVGPVDFHGELSQTFAYSDGYNYLGDTKHSFSPNISEFTLNGTYLFKNGIRTGAQMYAYKMWDYQEATLDWAYADYAVRDEFGIRAGRVRVPLGFYNEVNDLDDGHPLILRPGELYRKDYRDFTSSYDGGAFYGNVELIEGRLGSFDYHLGYGLLKNVNKNAPFTNATQDATAINTTEDVNFDDVQIYDLKWNTPVTNLRLGFTLVCVDDLYAGGKLKTASQLNNTCGSASQLPSSFRMSSAQWDVAMAGTPGWVNLGKIKVFVYGAEYTLDKWKFASEYMKIDITDSRTNFGLSPTQVEESYYFLTSYRVNDRLELGAYYNVFYNNVSDRSGQANYARYGQPNHFAWEKEAVLATAYEVIDNLTVKGEVHFVDGTGRVLSRNGENSNIRNWNQYWMYFALKTTYGF